jgi:apolipoprotein N-acyltransferase
VVICYEQLLSWSMLKAVSGTPDVLVGAANGWWAKDTSIPAIQREMMRAYGRLFGVGVVMAGNL